MLSVHHQRCTESRNVSTFCVQGDVFWCQERRLNKAERVPSLIEFMFYAVKAFILQEGQCSHGGLGAGLGRKCRDPSGKLERLPGQAEPKLNPTG